MMNTSFLLEHAAKLSKKAHKAVSAFGRTRQFALLPGVWYAQGLIYGRKPQFSHLT
jgi:hypothetical protein